MLSRFQRYFFAGIRLCLAPLIRILDFLIPVNPQIWLFCLGKPFPFNSNQRAFFDHVQIKKRYACYVLVLPGSIPPADVSAELCVSTFSLKGLWILLRAARIFVHHGYGDTFWGWGLFRQKRKIINLWHGIPVKGIGYLQKERLSFYKSLKVCSETQFFDATVCSSLSDRSVMSACYRLPMARFYLTGLPRNDWLTDPVCRKSVYFQDKLEQLEACLQGRRLILYAPTFRDQNCQNVSGVYPFSAAESEYLAKLLSARNAVLGIRAHINEMEQGSFENRGFLFLGQQVFSETQALLFKADLLISDYSSIWVDYLLLQRPVIGFYYDLESFQNHSRPLLYDLNTLFPGPRTTGFADLCVQIVRLLDAGSSQDEKMRYQQALHLFHAYPEGGASTRLYQKLSEQLSVGHNHV